ncbi:hypothetical protein AALN73_20335 [Bacteroides stercorirosoris]|uniref:hypothetical protein n=1 Tax=Bacteroides stercorirosoris TaxID=871324 RepID=UPI0023EFB6DA|nr:hypothetical protein [Bacteroides stercorirosoris]
MQILVNEQSTYKQNGKYKKNEESNGSNETNKTYHIVEQRSTSRKRVSDVSIIKEEWLAERIYFGINTYRYVSTLRAFKLGAYKGLGIKTISDLAAHLFASGEILKHDNGRDIPLKLSSIRTELRKVWAVIKLEDTEHIDPYGYDVKINP